MNIEWVRGHVRDALADIRIAENGQLGNLEERTRVDSSRFHHNPPRFFLPCKRARGQGAIATGKSEANAGKGQIRYSDA